MQISLLYTLKAIHSGSAFVNRLHCACTWPTGKDLHTKRWTLAQRGDLFTPGIQHICGKIANNEDVRNVMIVYFDHTSPSYRLPIAPLPSCHYHLPSHLPSFLHHLHSLDKNKMDLSQVSCEADGNDDVWWYDGELSSFLAVCVGIVEYSPT